MPTKPYEHADSPSLDAELALTDSETESEEEVPMIKARDQDEDQAGPNPGEQDEGQAGSNPGDAAESQPQPSHVVILEEPASSTGTLSFLQNLDKDLSFTDQFFMEKPHEEEPGETNAEAEVQSMVSVPIHQDTSSVPLMTTPVIDLTKSQSDSPLPTSTATTSTITSTTTLQPPPLQSTIDPILVCRIALLRARFRDLPTIDMKEIIQQRMFKDNTYKTHEVHNNLYEALQKCHSPSVPDGGVSQDAHRLEVRTHMRILSVIRVKAYSRYGYDYLSEIVLQRADFHEHIIAKKDFKNLYPNDFEDLNLLLLQGHLDPLPGSDKRMLSTALNLTKPGWDATGYEFKHDYTIIESLRAVVFPVNNNEQKIMRFNEIYKFSDGTLTHILEALDYRVKEFKVKRLNPGMNTRFWTEKDVTRSKEFIEAIERERNDIVIPINRYIFPSSCQSQRDLPRDNPLVSVEVLRSTHFYRLSRSELDDIEKVALCSSLQLLKTKCARLIKIIRVLRIILEVLPEHSSDTKVLTMKMEILLEPTSDKLLVVDFNSLVHSLRALSTLRRSGLRTASAAANPVKEILRNST
ncbi:hypothetical protein Tco_1474210 [Tanacetum coccineum]